MPDTLESFASLRNCKALAEIAGHDEIANSIQEYINLDLSDAKPTHASYEKLENARMTSSKKVVNLITTAYRKG